MLIFCSQLSRYQVVSTWMDADGYTVYKVNWAFHSSGVGKLSTGLSGWGCAGADSLLRWQVTLCDPVWQMVLRSSAMGFS